MQIIVHTDGGARGNPGPAAIGVVIEKINAATQKPILISEFGKTIGETTNNVAEYQAVIEALQELQVICPKTGQEKSAIRFFLDSNLVVNQLNGLFKIKDANLRRLYMNVRILETDIGGQITYIHIPREQNHPADMMVNRAMDLGNYHS